MHTNWDGEHLSMDEAWLEPAPGTTVVETHISYVVLTGQFAYKIKKPVRFDFLDFSTLAARRTACGAELQLNRRLAPHVYLEMVPVFKTAAGALSLKPVGSAVEWAVKMVQLPVDARMDRLVQAGSLRQQQVDELAALLTDFYRKTSAVSIPATDFYDRLAAHIADNYHQLERHRAELPSLEILRAYQAQLRFLRLHAFELESRIAAERVVDGHGDLRPEHVYFVPQPVVIDCIEFNEEYRQIDTADELAFLAMECDRLGNAPAGDRVAEVYQENCHDRVSKELLAFYKAYRACVRAKVAALRSEQLTDTDRQGALREAQEYLRLASRFSLAQGPPILLIVRGLAGTGKSTLASRLAELLGLDWLQTDRIRRELMGAAPDRYEPHNRDQVYRELHARAGKLLADGVSALLDGTFLMRAQLDPMAELADRNKSDIFVITCTCPAPVAKDRISRRKQKGNSLSEATPELYSQQQRIDEGVSKGIANCEVDTTLDVALNLRKVFEQMASRGKNSMD